MCILGIDPGTATTGYGIIKETHTGVESLDYGIISTSPEVSMEKRLLKIYQEIKRILILHRPDSCAVEKLFFRRNVTTAISVGQARGVILLAMAEENVSLAEYTPNEIKQAVAGYGAAGKRQIQIMVQNIFKFKRNA